MAWPDATDSRIVRIGLTRALVISVYGGWIVLLAMVLALIIIPSVTRIDSATAFATLLPYGLALYVWWFVGRAILRSWRRCDRCREPLFAEPGWFQKEPVHRDAQAVFGYINSTAWQYIRHGSARCMWCGHRDGETPDYVVQR